MEQEELELKLLNWLNGDREKYTTYAIILSTCTKPKDVANKVVKPMFIEGFISKDEISKIAYYGTLAKLVGYYNGHRIAPKSLYYHIITELPKWVKEKEAAQKKEAFRQETRIRRNTDGSVEITIYTYMNKPPGYMEEWLKSCIELGNAEMEKKNIRSFDARQQDEVTDTKSGSGLVPVIGHPVKRPSRTSYYINVQCTPENTDRTGGVQLKRQPLMLNATRTTVMLKRTWECRALKIYSRQRPRPVPYFVKTVSSSMRPHANADHIAAVCQGLRKMYSLRWVL